MIIAGVGPLLPQPQRDANIRLGAILALACSATVCSAVLVMTEIINFRNHTRNFLCVPRDESHRILSESESDSSTEGPSSSPRATAGSNSSQEQRQQQRGSATTSSNANQPTTPSNTGSEPPEVKSEGASSTEKGRNVEKSSDVATQTERRGG
ncbi:hypothetical protein SLS58_000901 [Diplodia intermedia]|uniref:Uncharacterized protein n=1 Tax=Diplodia intermedia TaxID=856260 RepID=A0ABR3U460_9PEZI